MNTLFSIKPDYPEGFSHKEDFITREEEMDLYKKISNIELHNFNFRGFKANRK